MLTIIIGAVGLKLHEDWGCTPAAIDCCLSVAEQHDIQVNPCYSSFFNFSKIVLIFFFRWLSTQTQQMNLVLLKILLMLLKGEQYMLIIVKVASWL